MRQQSMRGQAGVLAGTNVLVRSMGLILRVMFSRTLGAEAIGVMEVASSAHMLWSAPIIAGVPLAVSRLTASLPEEKRPEAARAGLSLIGRMYALMLPPLLIFMPWIAQLTGDVRTLPALYMMTPGLLFSGASGVLNGYCHGARSAWPPAISELVEQTVRFAAAAMLMLMMPSLSVASRAAVPAMVSLCAGGIGTLIIVLLTRRMRGRSRDPQKLPGIRRDLLRVAAPMTLSRLLATGLRAINALLIPSRLVASGLTHAEATAGFGMLAGMVLPVLFLPGVLTGALAVVSAPAAARLAGDPERLKRMTARALRYAALIGCLCMTAVFLGARFAATHLFGIPKLTPLFRVCCPIVFVSALHQVLCAIENGLGLQKKTLAASAIGGAVTLTLSLTLTGLPWLRLSGAALAMLAGQTASTMLNACTLRRYLKLNSDSRRINSVHQKQ